MNLPSKVNEINYLKKEDKGCTLYSYSKKNTIIIVARLDDFEIPHDFFVDDKAINMINLLSPIKSIKIDDNCMTIKGAKGSYKARFIEGIITLPNLNFNDYVSIEMDRLKIANKFVSTKDTRPILTGVNVNLNGNICATDSYMAYRYISGKTIEESKSGKSITIHKSFIDYIGSLFDKEVDIYFNENTCMVSKENVYYISRLLSGIYPDIDRIYNSVKKLTKITFDVKDLNEKLSIASILDFSSDYCVINFKNNTLNVKAENPYNAEINVDYSNEYEFNIAMPRLKAVLSNIQKNEMVLDYEGTFKQLYVEENRNEFVLLPMRV